MENNVFDRMDEIFTSLRRSVNRLNPPKRKRLVLEWLETWSRYLNLEQSFDYTKLRRYERGDIIFADFGFKVGNEFGGKHYAIVVENENQASNGTVIVVPMKSLDSDEEEKLDELDWKDVNLGKGLITWKPDKYNIAKVNQICALSKMRIIRPKSENETIIKLTDQELLNKIDRLIVKLLTRNNF